MYNSNMEADFTTRHHLDSVNPHTDPSIRELLNIYKNAPVEAKVPNFSNFDSGSSPKSDNLYISNMLGQLQGAINSITRKDSSFSGGDGLQLSVNADILRWMLVLVFLVVFVVVLFQFMSYRRAKNPLKRRLKKLENEIKALRSRNPDLEE